MMKWEKKALKKQQRDGEPTTEQASDTVKAAALEAEENAPTVEETGEGTEGGAQTAGAASSFAAASASGRRGRRRRGCSSAGRGCRSFSSD